MQNRGMTVTVATSFPGSLILPPPGGGKMKDPGKGVVTIGHSALGCQFNSGEPRAGKTWVRKTKSKNCFSPLKDSSQLVGPYLPLQIKLLWL